MIVSNNKNNRRQSNECCLRFTWLVIKKTCAIIIFNILIIVSRNKKISHLIPYAYADQLLTSTLTQSFPPHYGPGFDSTSNRNEGQGYFLGGKGGWCLWLTFLPSSCMDFLAVWKHQTPGTFRASPGLYRDFFTFLPFKVSDCKACR
jgi:hypothetical protein